jgi:F420-dependent oxidoreductase-like protein
MTPWFGLHLPSFTHPDAPPAALFDRVVAQAKAAEAAGFSLVSVMDHLYQIRGVGEVTEPMLEGWTTLAALARETSRVRLGTLVSGVTYRNPALLAKQATTLDTISGGRAIFGIGAAWNDAEHAGYGYEFPPVRERMDRLEEALTIAKAMFSEERPSFDGRFYRIEDALNVPRPVQPGGPRILVGGGGEQRTLRIAARFADMTPLVPARARRPPPQDGAPRWLLRVDRPRSRDDRADDGGAGARRGQRGRDDEASRVRSAGAAPVRGRRNIGAGRRRVAPVPG